MSYTFCTKNILAQKLGFSPHTLKAIRKRGDWIEGVHFVRPEGNSRVIRYNLELCINWLANQSNPKAHQREIEEYLINLDCNRSKKGR